MMMRTALFETPAQVGQLKDLEDNELLAKVRTLPLDSKVRASACEILVDRYQRLVRSCVRQYRNTPESTEELMQVGYVGLLKAINNFDPSYGGQLAAYARPCVVGEIKRHFRDKRWQVRVRRSAQELLLEMWKASEALTHTLGRVPDEAELAAQLGVTEEELVEARQADMAFHACSLDAPMFDGQDPVHLADLLGEPDEGVERTLDMEAVNAHWNELPIREQRILLMRFYGNLTQAEIGERLGISQMHVSRLLTRALGYLRDRLLGVAEDAEATEPAMTA
jgi:RNA polymerase sigma-B factor